MCGDVLFAAVAPARVTDIWDDLRMGDEREFTAGDYAARRTRAARAAAEAGLAGMLVTPGPDLTYLTGYQPTAITERLTALVVSDDAEPVLLVPVAGTTGCRRRGTHAAARGLARRRRPVRGAGADAAARRALRHLRQRLGDARARPAARPAGDSYASLTRALPMLRAVKDAHELARLAAAGAAADETFKKIIGVRFAGRTENDVAADLARLLREHGHSQVDFTVVGSGPNGANPHHEAGTRVIEDGDMVVLDFGGLKFGYGSDTTRTVHVGEPSDEEREVHDVVRRAQQAGFEAVRPGVACEEIDRAARKVITDAGYGEYFIHRVGHGIGLTTHEPPYMVEGEHQPLVPGMCFSIEPGVYLPGRFGVRIEDIVTCTPDGGRRLNDTPRELAIVA